MKALLTIPILAAILLTGCATVTSVTPEEDVVNRLAHYKNEAKIAAYLTTALYLEKHPEHTQKFLDVRNGVSGMIATNQLDPLTMTLFIRKVLPVKELKSERAGIFFMAGVMIFQEATGTIAVETPPIVKAFAEGIVEGIDMALAFEVE